MKRHVWLGCLLVLVLLLPTAACVFQPARLLLGGDVEIHVTFTQPHQNLTLAWNGEWLTTTPGTASYTPQGGEATSATGGVSGLQVSPSDEHTFPPALDLLPGQWQFVITAEEAGSEVFSIVCQEEILGRSQARDVLPPDATSYTFEVRYTEGEPDCDSSFAAQGPAPDPDQVAPGRIQIQVMFANPHPNLTLEWNGTWEGPPPDIPANSLPQSALEGESDSLTSLQVSPLERITFQERGNLKPGTWEFEVIGSVNNSDVFPPVVCRQQVVPGESRVLTVQEGEINCTSSGSGLENPKPFLWGQKDSDATHLNVADSFRRGTSEAFPDVADNTSDVSLFYILISQSTNLADVPQAQVAFYDDNAGQPGTRVGTAIPLNLQAELIRRERVVANAITGDTWLWFRLSNSVPLTAGNTYYLAVLDPCPSAGACDNSDATGRDLYLFHSRTDTTNLCAGLNDPGFSSTGSNETQPPDPWPAGASPCADNAPIGAFALGPPPAQ